jgi:hypothetical protein
MTEKPAKPAKRAKPAKAAKPAKRARATRAAAGEPTSSERRLSHAEIADRAYYIYLHEGESDPLLNWLRAERELAAR